MTAMRYVLSPPFCEDAITSTGVVDPGWPSDTGWPCPIETVVPLMMIVVVLSFGLAVTVTLVTAVDTVAV